MLEHVNIHTVGTYFDKYVLLGQLKVGVLCKIHTLT